MVKMKKALLTSILAGAMALGGCARLQFYTHNISPKDTDPVCVGSQDLTDRELAKKLEDKILPRVSGVERVNLKYEKSGKGKNESNTYEQHTLAVFPVICPKGYNPGNVLQPGEEIIAQINILDINLKGKNQKFSSRSKYSTYGLTNLSEPFVFALMRRYAPEDLPKQRSVLDLLDGGFDGVTMTGKRDGVITGKESDAFLTNPNRKEYDIKSVLMASNRVANFGWNYEDSR